MAHLGDYIHEYGGQDGRVRRHHGFEIRSVEDYRRRYAQYKSDPALQAMHAACPWLVTWDDHEVDNNYAGLVGENRFESREQMHARRAAAYQAWFEHQPVRIDRPLSWADLTITRSFHWGRMADLRVLDTRQYRTDQPCTDDPTGMTSCTWRRDPGATLLGTRQEDWLLISQPASTARTGRWWPPGRTHRDRLHRAPGEGSGRDHGGVASLDGG